MELVVTYGVFETSKGHKSPEGAYRIQKLYTKGPDISNTKNKKFCFSLFCEKTIDWFDIMASKFINQKVIDAFCNLFKNYSNMIFWYLLILW